MKKLTKVLAVVLVCMMAVAVLVACAPNSNPDKALAALKKNGYDADKDDQIIPGILTMGGVKGVQCVVVGTKTEGEGDNKKTEFVTIVYFDSADNAKAAMEEVGELAEEDKEGEDSDWTFDQSGKIIYYGTNAAIKAAR